MDFMNFRILNGLKRALIFKVSCLLFEISGQRFAKFAIDLNDAIRQLRKASLECFRDVLVLSHVLRHQWRPANIKKLSDAPTGSSALVSGSLAQVRCCCPLQTCGSQTPSTGQPPPRAWILILRPSEKVSDLLPHIRGGGADIDGSVRWGSLR